ncbi:hypothetical protein ACFFMR_15065 [Micromonospora andamanensis]|uniref:Histidine kinase n=1 Tax=Micromonospora andamanensis TaxID=1287068 RepID=A0ABQ4I649_9ACTN|nr:hypothetical protein [Micromonospora andamanensis]GIJ13266.1 hypothetical protein Van01_64800 [Micromonospora andamanensis]GIJ43053.1 hypothetical protein Vwe01_63780 [Micromonospora andamanensis]
MALTVAMALAGLAVVGADWMPVLYAPAVSALLVLRRPWAIPVAAAVLASAAPLGLMLGASWYWATWYVFAAMFRGATVFALTRLLGAVAQLQSAREVLASEAVRVERRRLDEEIRHRLDFTLQQIADQGERVATEPNPVRRSGDLRIVIGIARQTLTEVRRLVSRYHATSWRGDLSTAASLMTAAGITVRVSMPADLSDTEDAAFRTTLRAMVARLLADESVSECHIVVTAHDGRPQIDLRGLRGRDRREAIENGE